MSKPYAVFKDDDGWAYLHDTKNRYYVGDLGYDYIFSWCDIVKVCEKYDISPDDVDIKMQLPYDIRYKVVAFGDNDERISFSVRRFAQKVYEVRHWTVLDGIFLSKGMGLTVFDTIQHAIEHAEYIHTPFEIWECEVNGRLDLHPFMHIGRLELGEFEPSTSIVSWPTGTETYRFVRLVRRLIPNYKADTEKNHIPNLAPYKEKYGIYIQGDE